MDRKTMLDEANDLGLQFPGNISNKKLAELVATEKGEPTPILDDAPSESPAVKAVEPATDEVDEVGIRAQIAILQSQLGITDGIPPGLGQMDAKAVARRRRQMIGAARKKAFKKHIVTITNKDARENDKVSTAYLAFENQYFGVARSVPLDIPVELEESLIKIAMQCTMVLHKDEIKNGKATGNKQAVRVKKYVVSFSNRKPE